MTEIESQIDTFKKLIPEITDYMDMYAYEKEAIHAALQALREKAKNDRLRDEGRLVVLPCKVGDTVYTLLSYSGDYERVKERPYSHRVVFVGLNGEKDFFHTVNIHTERMFSFNFEDIGKTVFLTREAAEKALEGLNDGTKTD